MPSSLDVQLDSNIKKLRKKILSNLFDLMKSELLPRVEENLLKIYDSELVSKEPGYDPARPSVARMAFRDSINKSLKDTLEKSETSIKLSTGSIKELHLDSASKSYLYSISNQPSPLSWLVFYLEGFIGDYAFITKDTYSKFVDAGLVPKNSFEKFSGWGWYGQGFLIPKGAFFDRGFNAVIPYAAVRHPFSGIRPTKLFERAMDGIEFNKIVQKAIKKAIGN